MFFALVKVASPSADDIRAIKAPVPIPEYWFWFWVGLLVVAALVAAFLYRRWLKNRPVPVVPQVVIPPHVRARRKLEEARALMSEPKLFTIAVSDALRTYLEERFDFHAPERTTEEFLAELQSTPLLTDTQKNSLADFLSRCDLVKFARYEPTMAELESLYDAALRLVEETRPIAMPPASVNPAPAANPAP
jgi:hypothetical protein